MWERGGVERGPGSMTQLKIKGTSDRDSGEDGWDLEKGGIGGRG